MTSQSAAHEVPTVARPITKAGQVDLRGLMQALGTSTPASRQTQGCERQVISLLESSITKVASQRLRPCAVVDGCQSTAVMLHRQHRPVELAWVAAGGLDPAAAGGPRLRHVTETVMVVSSFLDREFSDAVQVAGCVEAVVVNARHPWDLPAENAAVVDATRRAFEQATVAHLLTDPELVGPVLVDGPIRPHLVGSPEARDRVVGVVKSTTTVYLPDDALLPQSAGERSPMFVLPDRGAGPDVLSAYVRLHDADEDLPWNHGLIRVEAMTEPLLEAIAALAMTERQAPGSPDSRWPVHLACVRVTEQHLRARRPYPW